MRCLLTFGATALLAALAFEPLAMAQGDQPVIVEYVAPPDCASSVAFQVLLETQIARFPRTDRAWRWAVRVRRRGGLYEGTLTSEGGVHTARSARCDDVTAAMALLIAEGETETPSSPLPPLCTPAPPPAPPAPVVAPPPALAQRPSADRVADHPSRAEWRLGARAELTNHGVVLSASGAPLGSATVAGGMAVLSLEIPGGFKKLLFEIGAGRLSSSGDGSPLTYDVIDTQACLIDLPVGTTGLSVLGCLRVAGASFRAAPYIDEGVQYPQNGGALWGGAGARLRWEARFGLFVEASLTGMYGTISGGESVTPGWVDAGVGAGFRL